LIGAAIPACSRESPAPTPRIYVSYPQRLDPACRDGKATLFDECGDQLALFDAALARAKAEKKVLLVEFGAEWCIWCHVFESHINGEHTKFKYVHGAPGEPDARYTTTFKEGSDTDARAASLLRDFVAVNFVIVHVEGEHSPNGYDVLRHIEGADANPRGIPYIFSVDDAGRFVRKFDHDAVEKRLDPPRGLYRGYNRLGLLKELTALRDAALAVKPGAPQ